MAILISLGIAFGFFIGCSTVSSRFGDTQQESNEALSEAELLQQLADLERTIAEEPGNARGHYRMGDLLNTLAHRQGDPTDRLPLYTRMKEALLEAESSYIEEQEPTGIAQVNELLNLSWSYEHNRGIAILRQDSTLTSADYTDAVGHFNNAIYIAPDSAISYEMKARAHYRNHQTELAIETLELAYERIDPLPSEIFEQLAFLYLEDDQPDMAVERYEQAETFSDDNLNLIHGLANAYIASGQHAKSVELLQTLVINEPDNIIYMEAYGNELYHLGMQRYDSVLEDGSVDSMRVLSQAAEADSLLDMSLEQYERALNLNPENNELRNQLAAYHQNYAAILNRALPLFPAENREEVEQQIEESLSSAISIFEQLVSEAPDNVDYWRHLYQAYSYLGMQEEAEEARIRANL